MAKKTVIRRVFNYLPKPKPTASNALAYEKALEVDNNEFDLGSDNIYTPAADPAPEPDDLPLHARGAGHPPDPDGAPGVVSKERAVLRSSRPSRGPRRRRRDAIAHAQELLQVFGDQEDGATCLTLLQ